MVPALIVIVIVVAAIAVFLYTRRDTGTGAAEPGAASKELYRPRPPHREFHVAGETAAVYFDAPLPVGEADPVLADLLLREAVEVLREKQSHDLPMEQVTRVTAYGRRNGEDVAVGSLSLETPGALPDIEHTEVVPHFSSVPFDPLTHLGEKDHTPRPGGSPAEIVAEQRDAPALRPLSEELTLTGRIESGLRAQGLDPATMSAGEMALGLMRLAGYTIQEGSAENTYVVSTPGQRTFLQVVDHGAGDYPELDENQIKRFQVAFASAGTDRGMLITEKFSPYMVYEAERRNPKCKFITRERLQDFVDSFSMS